MKIYIKNTVGLLQVIYVQNYLDTFFSLDTLINSVSYFVSQIAQNRVLGYFLHFAFPRLQKSEKKNIETTILDVKFDEESKSLLRIELSCNVRRNREIIKTC